MTSGHINTDFNMFFVSDKKSRSVWHERKHVPTKEFDRLSGRESEREREWLGARTTECANLSMKNDKVEKMMSWNRIYRKIAVLVVLFVNRYLSSCHIEVKRRNSLSTTTLNQCIVGNRTSLKWPRNRNRLLFSVWLEFYYWCVSDFIQMTECVMSAQSAIFHFCNQNVLNKSGIEKHINWTRLGFVVGFCHSSFVVVGCVCWHYLSSF